MSNATTNTIQFLEPIERLNEDIQQRLQKCTANGNILRLTYMGKGTNCLQHNKKFLDLQFNNPVEAESWKNQFNQLIEPEEEEDIIPEIQYEDLRFGKVLGQGAGGTVYEGKWKDNTVALKTSEVSLTENDEYKEVIQEIMREAKILTQLVHPNIMTFRGMSYRPTSTSRIFILCTELMDGSLKELLYTGKTLTRKKKLYISLEIAKGLKYLHTKNYVHRDLKPGNICVNTKDKDKDLKITAVKIIDFGISKRKARKGYRKMTANVGTPAYMAPELMIEESLIEYKTLEDPNSKKIYSVDIYSFGIMLWSIMHQKRPYSEGYEGIGVWTFRYKIIAGSRPLIDESIDEDISTLFKECWSGDPAKRPTAIQLEERLQVMYMNETEKLTAGAGADAGAGAGAGDYIQK